MITSLLQSPSFIIHTRQIRWLCHFTPRKNLASIKANGLLTRSQDASCLSISKPNKWMFKKKQEQGMDLCLILIGISVLYVKHCLFYPHNAASASYRNIPMSNFQGYLVLNAMFASEITYQKSGREPQTIWRNANLSDCETTYEQAELEEIYSKLLFVLIPYYLNK